MTRRFHPTRRLILAGVPAAALAQPAAWPDRAVELVVPFAAGGPTDRAARLLAAQLTEMLATPITVENRTGIIVGTDIVAKAAPDGSVLLYATIAHAIARAAFPILPYDPLRDFAPAVVIGRVPMVLLVAPSLPVRNVAELIAFLRAHPGELAYGSAGIGSALHLAAELFCARTGVQMGHVSYTGSAPALLGLQAGAVQMVFDTAASGLRAVREGIARGLMITGTAREPGAADIPTAQEAGLADFDAETWNAILAPRGTPAAVLASIAAATERALAVPALASAFSELGIHVERGSTPAAARAFLEAETARWEPVARAALGRN